MQTSNSNSRSRAWVWTLNNYTQEQVTLLTGLAGQAKYMVFGKEVGASGTPHLQGFTYLNFAKSFTAFKSWLGCNAAHIAIARDIEAAATYCKKDGLYFESGTSPFTQEDKGKAGKVAWEQVLTSAKRGKFDEIDARVQVTLCRNLEYIHTRELERRPLPDTEVKMLWFHGTTGTGKSRLAREAFPNAYMKMCNKWWDGYKQGEVVIIEDFDQVHSVLVHHLKIWLDRYPFMSELKGKSNKIRPPLIIVTSNYHPTDIWPLARDVEPILRRVRCYDFSNGVPQVDFGYVEPPPEEEEEGLEGLGELTGGLANLAAAAAAVETDDPEGEWGELMAAMSTWGTQEGDGEGYSGDNESGTGTLPLDSGSNHGDDVMDLTNDSDEDDVINLLESEDEEEF